MTINLNKSTAIKKGSIAHCATVTLVLFVGSLFVVPACKHSDHTRKIRIGWQVPWATQGQLVQVLKHTNALTLNQLHGEFKGFNYGGPLNEAALAGDVDVILTADQPAATLLARGAKWTIVARLMYNRVAIYVPPDSAIRTLSDLKGKRVAMPFGAAAQRDAFKAITDVGLDPNKDLTCINIDIYEQNNIVQAGNNQNWGDIDALAGFDPTPAIFEYKGLARMLHVGKVVSLVLMSNEYLNSYPDDSKRFLKAFIESWYYYATHQEQADEWFREESRLQFDSKVLSIAAAVEPNVTARSPKEIRPTLDGEDLNTVQSAAKFIHDQGIASVELRMSDYYNPSFVEAAWQEVTGSGKKIEIEVNK